MSDTKPQPVKKPAEAPKAAEASTPTPAATPAVAAPERETVRVRVKPGATIATATGRKVGGDWIDLDVRDMKVPNLRKLVETEEDIEQAALPAKQRAAAQAETQAMFHRFVDSDVRAAEREKAIRKPLLDALTPQGTAPGPASIG